MIYFIIFIVCISAYLIRYNHKYENPYKLICLFGKKGSGKTTTESKYMLHYASRGYRIYTDIDGCKLPGVTLFKLSDLKDHLPAPKSCILLDEVGLSMSNRDFKSFDKGLREFFKLQRHAKAVVIINSQGFDMDKSVRLLVDKFYFIQRVGPISLARPIKQVQKPNDMSSPTNDSPVLETYKWGFITDWKFTWIPRYARMFDSFALPARPQIGGDIVPGKAPADKKSAKKWLHDLNRAARKGK